MLQAIQSKVDEDNEIVLSVQPFAEEQWAKFSFNTNTGRFSWMGVKGTYKIEDHILNLKITQKPCVIPWSVIKSNLKKFLTQIHVV